MLGLGAGDAANRAILVELEDVLAPKVAGDRVLPVCVRARARCASALAFLDVDVDVAVEDHGYLRESVGLVWVGVLDIGLRDVFPVLERAVDGDAGVLARVVLWGRCDVGGDVGNAYGAAAKGERVRVHHAGGNHALHVLGPHGVAVAVVHGGVGAAAVLEVSERVPLAVNLELVPVVAHVAVGLSPGGKVVVAVGPLGNLPVGEAVLVAVAA